ncbi:MAG TPA: guanylate kinase [candidate division Zixibacteria bacterium]|nr:guanylate kinase [candidate division Zixibacteria bacterium]
MKKLDKSAAKGREGIVFIVSAPSGTGKSTVIGKLLSLLPDIRLSVSCTTRARRGSEVDGREYHFVTPRQFAAMRARGAFAEWAKVHGFFYGTPRAPLDRSIARGVDVLLDIDVQGARKIKRRYPRAVSIFLLPPSWKELERRLARRGTEGRETIRRRLANARREIRELMRYDYYVVNDNVRKAVGLLRAIVLAERQKTARLRGRGARARGLPAP